MMKRIYIILLLVLVFFGYFIYIKFVEVNEVENPYIIQSDKVSEHNFNKEQKMESNDDEINQKNNNKQLKRDRVDAYVQWAVKIADDNLHGYSQGKENATKDHPYTCSREGPDYDCASFVYYALESANFPIIEAWQNNPDYYNLYQGRQASGDADTIWVDLKRIGGFVKYSWEDVKEDLHYGDILCNPKVHVAIYIGNGKTVEAKGVNNPRGGDWSTGDQGGEIDYYNAYGRGWTEVYRYINNK